jgi:hypothetical protein
MAATAGDPAMAGTAATVAGGLRRGVAGGRSHRGRGARFRDLGMVTRLCRGAGWGAHLAVADRAARARATSDELTAARESVAGRPGRPPGPAPARGYGSCAVSHCPRPATDNCRAAGVRVMTVLVAAGCRAGLRSAPTAVPADVIVATLPHLGQSPEPPSKEYKQPQKQATSAITAPVRSGSR